MGRVFLLLLVGPFWVQLGLAAICLALGVSSVQDNARLTDARLALIQSAPPALIPIAEVQKDKDLAVQEVNLRATVALAHNTRLIAKTNFIKTDEDLMYVLQDEGAGTSEPVVRGVILLEPDQVDAFAEWVIANAVDFTETGPVVALNGLVAKSRNSSHISDVFRERGLERAENFVYLEPFFLPRDQALAQLPKAENDTPKWLFGIAAVFTLIAAFKWRRRGAKPASPAPEQPKPAPSFGPGFASSGFAQQRQTPTAAEIKAQAAAFNATAQPQSPTRKGPTHKGPSRVIVWLLAVPAVIFVILWSLVLVPAFMLRPKGMEFDLQDFLPLMGGSSLLILLPLSAFLILRNSFRGIAQFAPKSSAAPEPSAAAQQTAPQTAPQDGPVKTIPTLGKQIGGIFVPQKVLDYAPLAVGVVIMFIAPKVMKLFGADPEMGMAAMNTAPAALAPAPVAADLAAPATSGLPGLYLGVFAALLVLVALFWVMRHGITWGAKQIDPTLKDPWARIESERMRLG